MIADCTKANLFQIANTLMAPVSQLHGMGVEEFSQTGPTDRITAIVNRSKTNVVCIFLTPYSIYFSCHIYAKSFLLTEKYTQYTLHMQLRRPGVFNFGTVLLTVWREAIA